MGQKQAKKRPSQTTMTQTQQQQQQQSGMTKKTSQTQIRRTSDTADGLAVYSKRSNSVLKRKGSSTGSNKGINGNNIPPPTPPEIIEEDQPQQRRTLFDHLVAFYFRNDNHRLMSGDVDLDGIVDWALSGGPDGIANLNKRLMDKYGEDLDSFLINAAIIYEDEEGEEREEENEDEEKSEEIEKKIEESEKKIEETPSTTSMLSNEAALDRPAIQAPRRRPTNTMRFTLDENGQLALPESAQLDYPPIDLKTQLKQFIEENNPAKMYELDALVKFEKDYGLVALNSELLVAFGTDLKGNTLSQETDTTSVDIKKFGVGFDNKVISEMQNKKLNHEDSGKITFQADTGVCDKFRLDTESAMFGMCKCGHERAAHVAKQKATKSGTLERKLEQRRASINMSESSIKQAFASTTTSKLIEQSIPAADNTNEIQQEEVNIIQNKPPPPPQSTKKPSITQNTIAGGAFANTNTTINLVNDSNQPPVPSVEKLRTTTTSTTTKRPVSTKKKQLERLENVNKERKPKACSIEEFTLDMSASEFGTCGNCGWKKSDHLKKVEDPIVHNKKVDEIKKDNRPISLRKDGPSQPCDRYKLDINAESFGVCTCGFSKQAHMGQSSNQTAVSTTLEKRWKNLREIVN